MEWEMSRYQLPRRATVELVQIRQYIDTMRACGKDPKVVRIYLKQAEALRVGMLSLGHVVVTSDTMCHAGVRLDQYHDS